MENKRIRLVASTIAAISAVILVSVALSTARAAPSAPGTTVWMDDFDWEWSWIREDPTAWSLTARPGSMVITSQNGGLFGSYNDADNLLVRTAPNGDFQIETRVLYTPTENFQIAGLLIYQDDDNYMLFGRAFCNPGFTGCVGNGIYFDHEEEGTVVGSNYAMTTTSLSEAYLRVVRHGSIYTGYVSEDGANWTAVGAHTVVSGMVPSHVGLTTHDGNMGATEIPAAFDNFRLTQLPSTRFDSFDWGWSWIREDLTAWSLTAQPGSMVITSQIGGLLAVANDAPNLLVRNAPGGDFEIETRVAFEPSEDFQIAGLLIYEDDDNYMLLGRAYCNPIDITCVGNGIYFDHEEEGAFIGPNYAMTTTSLGEAYLRVVRQGSVYTGFVSENGTDWTVVGAHTVVSGMVPSHVGLTTHDSNTGATEIPAAFDYFTLDNYSTVWTDDFDWGWSWVREDRTAWSLTTQPGSMVITSQLGGLFGPTNNALNLLVRDAPLGDFEIETYVSFAPSENFQIAGLLLYQDDDNYMLLGRAHCDVGPPACVGNGIYFDHEEQGSIVGSNHAMTTTSLGEAYLRVVRHGTVYTGYVSENGTNWTMVGAHTVVSGMVPTHIGLTTHDGNMGATEIPAAFDYFQSNQLLTVWEDDFDWGWSWLRQDPTAWSLTAQPGSMVITSQLGGLFQSTNNARNLLLREANFGDFQIETHVFFTPTQDFHMAGLLIYEDDDNYLLLGRSHCDPIIPVCVGNGIYFDHEELGAVVGSNYATTTTSLGEAYLRIVRQGSVYRGYVSENGTDWIAVGEHAASGLIPAYVGLAAHDGATGATEIPAAFDYFWLEYSPYRIYLPLVLRN